MTDQSLESHVGMLLRQRNLTLATAESCTGGLLAHRLTNVAGSSDYYLGGVVAYSNAVKIALLKVERRLLEREGAVCEEVARQMARGVRHLLGADIGIGITGIAGPGGAVSGKPVGLVYIALAARGTESSERHVWPHDRLSNKEASVDRALEMVREHLESL